MEKVGKGEIFGDGSAIATGNRRGRRERKKTKKPVFEWEAL